jgi:L-ribulose-5-phosphate 3-epimerase
MDTHLNRRKFLTHSTAITLAAATGSGALLSSPSAARGAEIAPTSLGKGITVGLSQYSLRQMFSDGRLSQLDYPAFAKKEFGITSIDVWDGGFPGGKLQDPGYLAELKRRAADVGSNIFLFMSGVLDATRKTDAERKTQAEKFYAPIDQAARLGCTYVRIFLRAPDDTADFSRDASADASAAALKPLADRAKEQGLVIAIEPAASKLSSQGDYLVSVMERLNHPQCRLMPDFGKISGDVNAATKVMMPYSAVVSAKTHDFDDKGNTSFDYMGLMKIISESGFKGVIAVEYEGHNRSPVEGVRASQELIARGFAAL